MAPLALSLALHPIGARGRSFCVDQHPGLHRHVICGPPSDCAELAAAAPPRGANGGGANGAHAAGGDGRPPLTACLLFRPGHYDLLAPKDWAAAADEDTQPCFVPPLAPRVPPLAPRAIPAHGG